MEIDLSGFRLEGGVLNVEDSADYLELRAYLSDLDQSADELFLPRESYLLACKLLSWCRLTLNGSIVEQGPVRRLLTKKNINSIIIEYNPQLRLNMVMGYFSKEFLEKHPEFTRQAPKSHLRSFDLATDGKHAKEFSLFLLKKLQQLLLEEEGDKRVLSLRHELLYGAIRN